MVNLLKYAYAIVSQNGKYHGPNQAPLILNYAAILMYDFQEQQIDAVVESVKAALPQEGLWVGEMI